MSRFLLSLSLLLSISMAHAARNVLIFGDSLSAGFGIATEQSWPALLQKKLANNKSSFTVVNASISGETSAGGASRIETTLDRARPEVVVIVLGANDGLRGLPMPQLRDNLTTMVRKARTRHARVLLIGMRLPPNYGEAYTRAFEETFRAVARDTGTPLLPFLLEPIARDADAFQSDRLHPTATAQARVLDHVWPALKPLLKSP